MKHCFYLLLAGAVLCGSAEIAAQAKPAQVQKVRKSDVIRAAQNTARGKDLQKTIEAYDKVFALTDLTSDERADAHLAIAGAMLKANKQKDAFAEADKVFTLKEASSAARLRAVEFKAQKRFRDNFPNSGIVYDTNGIEDALKYRREAFKLIPDMTNMQKIGVYQGIANCLLELMKVDEANTELIAATKLPNLTPDEKSQAFANLGAAYNRELEPAKALAAYEQSLADMSKLSVHQRCGRIMAVITLANRLKGKAAAEAVYKKYEKEYGVADAYISMQGGAALEQKNLALLKNPKGHLGHRVDALKYFLNSAIGSGDPVKFESAYQKYAVPAIKENPAFKNAVMGYQGHWFNQLSPAMRKAVAAKQAELDPKSIGALKNCIGTLNPVQDRAEMIKKIDALLKLEKISRQDVLAYSVKAIVLKNKNGKTAAKQITDLYMKDADEKLHSNKVIVEALTQAARLAMQMKEEQMAKDIWSERAKLFAPMPRRTLPCTFIANGPKDIAGFLASPYIKDPKNVGVLDRKYGDNLDFLLLTDSAITGRKVTEDKAGSQPTTFVATCDETGVKLFFMMPCTPERAKNLRLGYGGFGGFEMYIATGFDQPYHCYLIDAPPNVNIGDSFMTQYDNRHFRRYYSKNKNLNVTFRIDDTQVLMLLEMDWTGVMNGIPTDGFKWELEPLHWERGGWSWGGSISVHNRSSFGDLVFANMTPANRTLIKRRLLSFAKKAYFAEFTAARGGIIEKWADPDLGDVKFDKEVVIPFKTKYTAYANAIKPEMTDEEVNKVYDEAYDVLINAKFVIQDLRREYLEKELVSEE